MMTNRKNRFSIKIIAAVVAVLAVSGCSGRQESPRVSIFADHIGAVSRQEEISFAEAASIVRGIGYAGADVRVTQDPAELKILDSLGFKHSCCIANIDYCSGEVRPDVSARLAAFAARAAKEGLTVMVEDYDNASSPCFNTEMLKDLFSKAPSLMHNFDSGNYIIAGEDCLEALKLFRERIAHVHLKDRVPATDFRCPAVGSGCLPEAEVIRALVDSGYDGWFTVEHFGAKDMLTAARESYSFIISVR